MRPFLLAVIPLIVAAGPPTEVENRLRGYFVGKKVVVKLDMPASSDGVDLTPGEPVPLDSRKYSSRLSKHGVSIREGESVAITHVEIKDKLIELHLGGGGFQHWRASSGPSNQNASSRERSLEREIRNEKDSRRRSSLQRELDSLRRQRRRENELNAELRERQQERNHERSLQGGSRFNIRFPQGGMVAEATPEIVMRSLEQWVEFETPRPGSSTKPAPRR
jgi:hypothetical protein